MWPAIFIIIGASVLWCYINLKNNLNYWKTRGIQYIPPWPLIGNLGQLVIGTKSFADISQSLYNAFPKARYVGYHHFAEPSLLIRDPDLIKQITVKDFDYFPDHQLVLPKNVDSIWDKTIFVIAGGEWHEMRRILSPTFGSMRMRTMFEEMKGTTAQFIEYYRKQESVVTVDMKDVLSRCANDIIANTIFGIHCDSIVNPQNELFLMAKQLNDTNDLGAPSFVAHFMNRSIMKFLNVTIITKESRKFFTEIMEGKTTLSSGAHILRSGLIQSLMETQKERTNQSTDDVKKSKPELSVKDIIAQAASIYIAGFDTTAVVLSFMSYELAVNPEIQDKLHDEIENYLKLNNGLVDYDSLLALNYLDKVVQETLRKWPPSEFVNRKCAKPYTIQPKLPNENPLQLQTNLHCLIPVYAIQRDPKYYPNPDRFDPERFEDKLKQNRNPFTFISFGTGPRNCIGSRFGTLMLKYVIFEILRNFNIVVVEKTQIPLKLKKGTLYMVTERGIWLGLERREI